MAYNPDGDLAVAQSAAALTPTLALAVGQIYSTHGDAVSIIDKAKPLTKFGHSSEIDNSGYKTVWEGTTINNEPPLFGDPSIGNTITEVVSATGGDTQTLTVEGHTKAGDDLTFVVQSVTLTGQGDPQILLQEGSITTPGDLLIRRENVSVRYAGIVGDGETLQVPW